MKPVKILLSVIALGMVASAPMIRAQDEKPAAPAEGQKGERKGGKGGGRGMMSPEQQVERIDQAVSLTAEQKTKILAIFTKAQEKMQALPQEERREKGREIGQAARDEVRALLTPEQQKKLDEMPQRGPGGPGGERKKKGA